MAQTSFICHTRTVLLCAKFKGLIWTRGSATITPSAKWKTLQDLCYTFCRKMTNQTENLLSFFVFSSFFDSPFTSCQQRYWNPLNSGGCSGNPILKIKTETEVVRLSRLRVQESRLSRLMFRDSRLWGFATLEIKGARLSTLETEVSRLSTLDSRDWCFETLEIEGAILQNSKYPTRFQRP